MTRAFASSFIIAAALVAGGCSVGSNGSTGFGQQIGLVTTSPDEFLIIAHKPLQLPPNFELTRPTPGVKSRVELDPLADAHGALFQRPDPVRLAVASPGEQVLLDGADASGENGGIRAVLDDETPVGTDRRYGLSTLLGFPIPANLGEDDEVLDSEVEIEALRDRGLPTPAAPPPVEKEGGLVFRGGS